MADHVDGILVPTRRKSHAESQPAICVPHVFRFSEQGTYNRIAAARTARRFPVTLDLLADGSINLTTVRLLAPHLTEENHRTVLEAARGKRTHEVEKIVAGLAPRPDVADSIRKLPSAPQAPRPPASTPDSLPAQQPAAFPSAAPLRPAVSPLAPERYKLQFTIGEKTLEKLDLAKDMLRHAVPTGDLAAVFDRALTVLLEDLAKKKFAATERPHVSRAPAPGSRHIPAEVKRAVWLRDLGRCTFVGANNRRCTSRGFLEFDHIVPFAVGGEATVENIRLLCKKHNGHEADLYFGPRGPNGRGGFVREEPAPYDPAGMATRFKRVAGERLSRPELSPMDVANLESALGRLRRLQAMTARASLPD